MVDSLSKITTYREHAEHLISNSGECNFNNYDCSSCFIRTVYDDDDECDVDMALDYAIAYLKENNDCPNCVNIW